MPSGPALARGAVECSARGCRCPKSSSLRWVWVVKLKQCSGNIGV